ncbi:DUF1883 domain-containing protein [Lactococcus lactis]|uniref:DUF1883 domain-containing protein n=1 Tax=Lactococcus lactis TaxID=1358 RepID=UPI0022E9299B|nr:DUF1883 domain-containing protein [Lactococcus lactis]
MQIPYCDNPGGPLTVTVHLQHRADVFLVDEQNYRNYKSGHNFRYFGGNATKTPVTITVNGPGRWYLIVDNGSGESYRYQWS